MVAELDSHIRLFHELQLAGAALFSHALISDALVHGKAAGTAGASAVDWRPDLQSCQHLEPKVDLASSTDWHKQHLSDVAVEAMWVRTDPELQCQKSNGMHNPDNSTPSSCSFFHRDKSRATKSSPLESHEGAHNRSSDEH